MVVDGKGQIFEDRRKKDSRRKNTFDATGGRRENGRRKEDKPDNKESKK